MCEDIDSEDRVAAEAVERDPAQHPAEPAGELAEPAAGSLGQELAELDLHEAKQWVKQEFSEEQCADCPEPAAERTRTNPEEHPVRKDAER